MLVSFFVIYNVKAILPAEPKDFVGEWQFENPNAPYNYQKGTFLLQEQEDELVGKLKFSDGYEVKLQDVVVEDGVLTFGMNIESYYITVTSKVDGEKLTGKVVTPDGDLPLEAVKVKKEEE